LQTTELTRLGEGELDGPGQESVELLFK